MNHALKVIFIVGSTSVGKSNVGFDLARKINGEIVSCDSMQVYTQINIASNKPSLQMISEVAHHLIDIISVEDEYDVNRFRQMALVKIEDIHSRGRIPIVVGGSGLYMKILLDGIFKAGERNEPLRERLIEEAQSKGSVYLHDQLREKDLKAADRIHPNDLKRIVRALEVYFNKGKTISELHKDRSGIWDKYDITIFGLNRDRALLYERIEERVDEMFEEGLVEEIKSLSAFKLSQTAQYLIGVKEVQGYLDGEYDLERAKYLMKRNTRRFAKRQLTWFRKDERVRWIDTEMFSSASEVANEIVKFIS